MQNNKHINRTFIKYLLPTLGSMILFSSYTMVDGIFVGQGVGATALSAVNVSLPFTTVMFALAMLISIGSSNMITYQLGKGNRHKGNQYFSFGIVLTALLSLLIALLAYFNIEFVLSLLGAEFEIRDLARDYLSIIILFSPFFALTYVFEIFIKADGHPRLALILTSLSALTNIVLDYVFIFIFDYGIVGAAVATGLAQVLPTVGYMIHFLSAKSTLSFENFPFSWSHLKQISKFGFPSALTELSSGFTILLFNNTIIDYYGPKGLASFSVIVYLMNLVINTMLAIVQSGQPLMSYSYGKKDYAIVKQLRKLIFIAIAFAGLVAVVLVHLFPNQIIQIFLSDLNPEFVQFTVQVMKTFSYAFLILGFNIGIGGYLTAIRFPQYELIISILRGYIMIFLVLIFAPQLFGSSVIWSALTISEILTLVCSIYLLYQAQKRSVMNIHE